MIRRLLCGRHGCGGGACCSGGISRAAACGEAAARVDSTVSECAPHCGRTVRTLRALERQRFDRSIDRSSQSISGRCYYTERSVGLLPLRWLQSPGGPQSAQLEYCHLEAAALAGGRVRRQWPLTFFLQHSYSLIYRLAGCHRHSFHSA